MSLLGFVIMPEHFHLLIVPSSGTKISWIMQEIKKGSARLINKDRFCRAQGRARLPNETPFLKNPGTLGRPRPRLPSSSPSSAQVGGQKNLKKILDKFFEECYRIKKI